MSSNRHHYLPEFYIKGFVNSNHKLYVYNKQEGKFKNDEFSPRQIFFEWNRNTLMIHGKHDDFIEKLYGQWESMLSPTYNKIKNQLNRIQCDVQDIFNLLLLISLTYWRIPINDENAETFILSTPSKELFIKIYQTDTNKEVSEDFYTEIKKREGFIEMYKIAKPIFDYVSLDIANNIKNWNIYSADSDVRLHLLGDNPIIFKSTPSNNILESELIFPLTKGVTIYHTKGKKISQIQPESRVKVDIMTFLQSSKYIVGPNKEYLNYIQMLAKQYNTELRVENLRSELFKIFEQEG